MTTRYTPANPPEEISGGSHLIKMGSKILYLDGTSARLSLVPIKKRYQPLILPLLYMAHDIQYRDRQYDDLDAVKKEFDLFIGQCLIDHGSEIPPGNGACEHIRQH